MVRVRRFKPGEIMFPSRYTTGKAQNKKIHQPGRLKYTHTHAHTHTRTRTHTHTSTRFQDSGDDKTRPV